MTETYQPWRPDPDALTPCAGIVLHAYPADLTVRLQFSDVRGAPDRDLLVRFGREVVACMSHDEFVHPWQYDGGAGEVPRLPEPWAQYAHPLLLVEGSRWLASFSDVQIAEGERAVARHFRFVSLDNTVDVLTVGDAVAEWAPAAARGP